MKKLYVCEYPYILYKVIIERLLDDKNENTYSLIISDSAANLEPMVPVLKESGLFERVEFFSSEPYRSYYKLLYFDFPKNFIVKTTSVLKNHIKMVCFQNRFKYIEFPFSINFSQYDKIFCSDGPYVINGYLATNQISYSIVEHAYKAFSMLSLQTNLFYLLIGLLDELNIVTGIKASTKYCKEVVVDTMDGLPVMAVKGKKLTVFDSRQNLSKLSADQRDCLFYLYSKACALKIDYSKKYDLLLTNPLYSDSYLPSEESQINFYMDMVKQYFTRPVLIKPHPRDHVNYRNYFPEAVVIDENISCEILMLSKNLQLSTVLTVFSSAAGQFEGKAEQVIKLSQSVSVQDMPFLNPYKNEGA